MRKIASFLALMIFFTFGVEVTQVLVSPTVAYAAGDDLSSVVDNIKSGDSVIGDDAKRKIDGIANDAQSLVIEVVVGVLICTTAMTALKFNNVGDNSTAKSVLKTALVFEVLGVIFLASFLGFIKFGLQHFNLFGK
ncbi:hypothetical protein GKZ28_08685 [Clostridium chromiireducens]|jgi:hypothetical protein|uniref:Uncharacterized protein n=1 Tax=Clostridium chromiireducens TaxID=225345 RepID=A0A964RLJ2_9CLOT|nr:hypothetical protein [Clostridium chromiireducens]MVX63770.1 hypothetical protein [Clostridium chromiireducens]